MTNTNFSLGRLTRPSSRLVTMLQGDKKPNTMTSIFTPRDAPISPTFNKSEAQKNKKMMT